MSRFLTAGSQVFIPPRQTRESALSTSSMEERTYILSGALNALLVLGFVALVLAFSYPDAVTSFLDRFHWQ